VADEREQKTDGPDSVFGNLPTSRPGTRSPRRDSAARSKARSGSAAKAEPKQATRAKPTSKAQAQPKPRPQSEAQASPETAARVEPSRRPTPPEGAQGAIGGVEDLAWAGVAVAAEAATLGVRLASKAIEAMRGTTERD
jgi:hypothetical protein